MYEDFAKEINQDEETRNKVKEYILCTINHKPKSDDIDLLYFLDFDIAILGKDPEGKSSQIFP